MSRLQRDEVAAFAAHSLLLFCCKLDAFKDLQAFMTPHPSRKTILALAGLLVLIASLALGYTKARSVFSSHNSIISNTHRNQTPQIILWAWERPTDLRFIDKETTGVAFLARTIRLSADEIIVRPRLQTLNLPEGTQVIPVARIEVDRKQAPKLSAQQRSNTAREIAGMASLSDVKEIQIDFDATQTQRSFYRDLIFDVRRRLPADVRLSITALASWCAADGWISDLPIDEAVPMLFRMAGDGKQIVNQLNSGADFDVRLCRQSYGISLDEQRPSLLPSRRLYVFNPDAWTEKSVREITESTK